MAKATKLTEQQVRMIVAAAAGGATLRDIAAEYGVSKDKISKILRANKEIKTNADKIKKDADKKDYSDLADFFSQNRGKLAGRVAKALNVPDEVLEKASVRDRAGFAKVVTELILEMRREGQEEGSGGASHNITFVFSDTSVKAEGSEDG
jgi:hypothetical protein